MKRQVYLDDSSSLSEGRAVIMRVVERGRAKRKGARIHFPIILYKGGNYDFSIAGKHQEVVGGRGMG